MLRNTVCQDVSNTSAVSFHDIRFAQAARNQLQDFVRGLLPFLMDHPLDDDAAALIAGMPQLVRLRVSEITVTEDGVQQMARMSQLRFIHSDGGNDSILVLRAALPEYHIP